MQDQDKSPWSLTFFFRPKKKKLAMKFDFSNGNIY